MDLNYLFARHQTELMRSAAAACPEARYSHRALADAYARTIRRFQDGVEATTAPLAGANR